MKASEDNGPGRVGSVRASRGVADQLTGVQQTRKDGSRRAVNKVSLRAFVRGAVHKVLAEEKDALLPLLQKLETQQKASFKAAEEDRQNHVATRTEFKTELTELGLCLAAELKQIRSELSRDLEVSQGKSQNGLETLNCRIASLQASMGLRLHDLEGTQSHLQQGVDRRIDESQETLKAWVSEEVMKELLQKYAQLEGMIAGLPDLLSPRDGLQKVEKRLERIELDFRAVATRVENYQIGLPDTAQEEMVRQELQSQLARMWEEIDARREEIKRSHEQFFGVLEEFKARLKRDSGGRELRQGMVLRRLIDLRDGLRQHMSRDYKKLEIRENSFWDKLMGRNGRAPALTAADVENFRGLLADVLDGVEFLIFEIDRNVQDQG